MFIQTISAITAAVLLGTALYLVRASRGQGKSIGRFARKLEETQKHLTKVEKNLHLESLKLQAQLPMIEFLTKNLDTSTMKFVLSLTSHPARFDALAQMLPTLRSQILQPQKIYLNIYSGDSAQLPRSVRDLASEGFITICEVEDLGPGKKLIPTLQVEQTLPIITIDDDLILSSDLTLQLMIQHSLYPQAIIASRTHLVVRNENGAIEPFSAWQKAYNLSDGPSSELLPTSGAGTLFPAGSLHPDAINVQKYKELSFHTDDLWWFFQARRIGTLVRRLPGYRALEFIPESQEAGLWNTGNKSRNDENLSLLIKEYGDLRGA